MRLHIVCIGAGRGTQEQALAEDYGERIRGIGNAHGISDFALIELREKSGGQKQQMALMRDQLARLTAKYGKGRLVALDASGKQASSRAFADMLQNWRAEGNRHVSFLIGGADGFDAALIAQADFCLSLGKMTWPHLMVRAMLAEQIWRGLSILSNHPYHRA